MQTSLLGLAGLEPLLAVGLVLGGILVATSWASKRLRGGAGARTSVALTGQHAVHVIELDGERMLIGTGPSGAPRLLARLPAKVAGEVGETAEGSGSWLERVLAQWETMRG